MTTSTTEVDALLSLLPSEYHSIETDGLIEIVADYGRPLEFRYLRGSDFVEDEVVTETFLNSIISGVGTFGPDNRAGQPGTLHRISRIVDRNGAVVGLTLRVGRPFLGAVDIIKDLIDSGHNILLLGAPGTGKTTRLRDVARYLANERKRRVVIIDTSNEIAGDGRVPHAAVGRARRMQVPFNKDQHHVMIEAVENHMPECIVIDEISTRAESDASRTIAQRGVQLVATAHGRTLEDLMKNPPLVGLIGGVQTVTLSDAEATRRGTTKTVQERQWDPVFTAIVEIESFNKVRIHTLVAEAVDANLSGGNASGEVRLVTTDGRVITEAKAEINHAEDLFDDEE